MAHARATLGTTNYAVAITAGHHQLNADEGPALVVRF
jgi:putative redox protein